MSEMVYYFSFSTKYSYCEIHRWR